MPMDMEDDHYQMGSASNESDAPEGDSEDNSKESDSETALIPKSMLKQSVKVGDTCKFKIVHMYDDEAEIKWTSDGKKESEDSDESKKDPFAEMT